MHVNLKRPAAHPDMRERGKIKAKPIGWAHTLWVFGRREGGVDVEKLHRMVFDLSSFEGGGELETREQDLASHHQAKNSVARGGLPARDITALARYLRGPGISPSLPRFASICPETEVLPCTAPAKRRAAPAVKACCRAACVPTACLFGACRPSWDPSSLLVCSPSFVAQAAMLPRRYRAGTGGWRLEAVCTTTAMQSSCKRPGAMSQGPTNVR